MEKHTSEGILTPLIKEDWWAYSVPEVLTHYPPRFIIGKQIG